MRTLLSTYGSRANLERMVGLAVPPGALGAADQPARAAEEGAAAVATGVMPAGGWR